jgi:Pvc16 N-terminal domain
MPGGMSQKRQSLLQQYFIIIAETINMIAEALSFITHEMNIYLKDKLGLQEDAVLLSDIKRQDGSIAIQGENKVVITLLNIEQETIAKNNRPAIGQAAKHPVSLKLTVLFSAYFGSNNYTESLRFISIVISFLEDNAVFTSSNNPTLDTRINKLSFEMENYNTEMLQQSWATLGANYMPSVIYKMRMQIS